MILFCRVDERLLHGQVAVNWFSEMDPDSVLIANDEIVENEIAKMAIKMVKPDNVSLAIRGIESGAEILNDPRGEILKIFVIVKTIKDMVQLSKLVPAIQHVNIGGIKKKEGSRLISPAVYLNQDDLEPLRQLCELVKKVEFRNVPSDLAKDARDFLK